MPRDMAGLWGKCRTAFRWCRFTVWLIILAALLTVLWFNRVGLPDFLKTRLVDALAQRGVNLQFSRMRLSHEGLVADNVQLGNGSRSGAAVFTAKEIQLQMDFA